MYEIKTFPSGLTVVGERMDSVRSVTLGVWVASGSRSEGVGLEGISHYIEHMIFKGTSALSASDLADRIDTLGGEVNAYTTKELTCFYGRVLDEELLEFASLLSSMLTDSAFDPSAVETERGVILEEIGMYEDNPEDLVSEKLTLGIYEGGPLGHPILGYPSTLEKITSETLRDYIRSHYTSLATVISVAGNYPEGALERIGEMFSPLLKGPRPEVGSAEYRPVTVSAARPTEQSNIVLAFKGLPLGTARRYEMSVLNSCLGGNMSSRLFQRVRERLGLCYSIYSYVASHTDTGMLGIYLGCSPSSEEKACAEIGAVLNELAREGVTEDEVTRIKRQLRASLLMSLESTSSRSSHLGKSMLMYGRIPTPDELRQKLEAVTAEGVNALAREIFDPRTLSFSQVAPKPRAESLAEVIRQRLDFAV
ncbi:MAG: insulinase family protein [Clostridia bacterium]|nr:insulinase family protein [Clostridia bacterium]